MEQMSSSQLKWVCPHPGLPSKVKEMKMMSLQGTWIGRMRLERQHPSGWPHINKRTCGRPPCNPGHRSFHLDGNHISFHPGEEFCPADIPPHPDPADVPPSPDPVDVPPSPDISYPDPSTSHQIRIRLTFHLLRISHIRIRRHPTTSGSDRRFAFSGYLTFESCRLITSGEENDSTSPGRHVRILCSAYPENICGQRFRFPG